MVKNNESGSGQDDTAIMQALKKSMNNFLTRIENGTKKQPIAPLINSDTSTPLQDTAKQEKQ